MRDGVTVCVQKRLVTRNGTGSGGRPVLRAPGVMGVGGYDGYGGYGRYGGYGGCHWTNDTVGVRLSISDYHLELHPRQIEALITSLLTDW